MTGGIFPKPYADFVARLRVPCGFLLVTAFAYISQPTSRSLEYGIPISILGLLLRAWAAGHLAKNQQLAMSGPYAYVRNPLYAGTILVAIGLAVAARSAGLAALFAVVFTLVYIPAIALEEQHLRKLFPEYSEYAQRVPALIPYRVPRKGAGRFQQALYRKNEEYKALLGFFAGVVWLIWKSAR